MQQLGYGCVPSKWSAHGARWNVRAEVRIPLGWVTTIGGYFNGDRLNDGKWKFPSVRGGRSCQGLRPSNFHVPDLATKPCIPASFSSLPFCTLTLCQADFLSLPSSVPTEKHPRCSSALSADSLLASLVQRRCQGWRWTSPWSSRRMQTCATDVRGAESLTESFNEIALVRCKSVRCTEINVRLFTTLTCTFTRKGLKGHR